jgi:hypothetical protein
MGNKLKEGLISFGIGVLVGIAILYFTQKPEVEIVEVPVEIEVKVPEIIKETDTVYYPKPVFIEGEQVIDTTLYAEYNKLKDQVKKDSLFKAAITIKEYKEVVEDDTIKIDLYAKVRGDLLNYQLGYNIKPRVFKLDTILSIPVPKKMELYYGVDSYIPAPNSLQKAAIIPSAMMINKKHTKAYQIGYDPFNKAFKGGIFIRL